MWEEVGFKAVGNRKMYSKSIKADWDFIPAAKASYTTFGLLLIVPSYYYEANTEKPQRPSNKTEAKAKP